MDDLTKRRQQELAANLGMTEQEVKEQMQKVCNDEPIVRLWQGSYEKVIRPSDMGKKPK